MSNPNLRKRTRLGRDGNRVVSVIWHKLRFGNRTLPLVGYLDDLFSWGSLIVVLGSHAG